MPLPDDDLARILREDVPHGDLTTGALGIAARPGRLEFRARQAMRLCGTEDAARIFGLAGATARPVLGSGTRAEAGDLLLEAAGTAGALHRAWKGAQTLVEWASGLASAAADIVAAAGPVPVACTRKNVPGTRALSARAVRAGGARLHRLGLSETLLVFHEHRLFLAEPAERTVARLRAGEPEKKVVVEVADVAEALAWARAGADVLQLEKFTPADVTACRQAVAALAHPPLLAAAGGIHAGNAADYAAAGAGLLVTSAPYTAPPRDVQVVFFPC